MDTIVDIINELKDAAESPGQTVRKSMAQTGKKAVGCFPIYAPEELVYAAGALPVGMWGGRTAGSLANKYLQSFCCSIMRANTEQSLRGDYDCLSAVITTAYCDTLKCIIENWKIAVPHLNIIPMVYPQNRKSEWAKDYFKEELERVKGELEGTLDVTITQKALTDAVDVYDNYRAVMNQFVCRSADYPDLFGAETRHQIIKAAYFMDKKAYTEKMRIVLELLDEQAKGTRPKKKIILTGLMAEPIEMLELFDENGFVIAADDLAQESRQFRTIVKEGTALDRMVRRIVMQDGCAFLYDEKKSRGGRLIGMVREFDAAAVVFCQLKFCDPDEFDYPIIKKQLEKAGIPLLHIELEQQMESVGQLRTRIQSFAEMLERCQ